MIASGDGCNLIMITMYVLLEVFFRVLLGLKNTPWFQKRHLSLKVMVPNDTLEMKSQYRLIQDFLVGGRFSDCAYFVLKGSRSKSENFSIFLMRHKVNTLLVWQ